MIMAYALARFLLSRTDVIHASPVTGPAASCPWQYRKWTHIAEDEKLSNSTVQSWIKGASPVLVGYLLLILGYRSAKIETSILSGLRQDLREVTFSFGGCIASRKSLSHLVDELLKQGQNARSRTAIKESIAPANPD
jgi:hypothetical protein